MAKTTTQADHERAVVGSIIATQETALPEIEGLGLTVASFTDAPCRAVFDAVTRLKVKGAPLDVLTITEESGLPVQTVEKLIEAAVNPGHVRFHAQKIMMTGLDQKAQRLIVDAKGNPVMLRAALARIKGLLPEDETDDAAITVATSEWLALPDEVPQEVAGGLIDEGGRVAIVGQSKGRKSFFALQLALAIASGSPFLGIAVNPRRVLLVNGEITAAYYKRRVRRMAEALDIHPDKLAGLVVANTSEDASPWDIERILSLAQRLQVQVAVVDPFYLLLDDETDQTVVKGCVRSMKRFARAGITLISVFHATKGRIGDKQVIDRISGSGIFARDCSTLISLCEHATEQDHVVMSLEIRNHPPMPPVTLQFSEGAFTVADSVAAVEKSSLTKPRVQVDLDCAARAIDRRMPYRDAIEAVKTSQGCGRNRAVAIISQMVNAGKLTSEVCGRVTFYERSDSV